MTIRARLDNGEYATLIGPDPNGGHVIRLDNGDMHTVDHFTPEFGNLLTPQWVTSVYQGRFDGLLTWPTLEAALNHQADQLRGLNRITPVGQLIEHQGLYVLADSTGQPLKAAR